MRFDRWSGGDRARTVGMMLEVGVLDFDGNDLVAIHAMTLRPKFYRFLG